MDGEDGLANDQQFVILVPPTLPALGQTLRRIDPRFSA